MGVTNTQSLGASSLWGVSDSQTEDPERAQGRSERQVNVQYGLSQPGCLLTTSLLCIGAVGDLMEFGVQFSGHHLNETGQRRGTTSSVKVSSQRASAEQVAECAMWRHAHSPTVPTTGDWGPPGSGRRSVWPVSVRGTSACYSNLSCLHSPWLQAPLSATLTAVDPHPQKLKQSLQ